MALLLEVIVQSVADAREAEAGGADRLEVVRAIDRGGLTPDLAVVDAIARATPLPLRVMVRDSAGFTIESAAERASLLRAIASFAALGVDGVVLGFARRHALDLDATAEILAAAPSVAVTFHRAFETAANPFAALDALKTLPQVDRVLTNSGAGAWTTRCERLRHYATHAAPSMTIIAGGSVEADALRLLAASGCVTEAHVGRAAREPQLAAAPVSARRVRLLRTIAGER